MSRPPALPPPSKPGLQALALVQDASLALPALGGSHPSPPPLCSSRSPLAARWLLAEGRWQRRGPPDVLQHLPPRHRARAPQPSSG